MSVTDLPPLHAALNAVSALCLAAGYAAIRRGHRRHHRRFMVGALIASVLFLSSYLVYHADVGSVPYPLHDWTRTLYLVILVPHILLAALMLPGITTALHYALRRRFDRHTRIARWVWPVWMFVALSGIVVYVMLYRYAGATTG